MTDIQAGIGLCQLDRLDDMLARRRRIAERYIAALANHPLVEPPYVPAHVTPNWQSFQVRVRPGGPLDRTGLMTALDVEGIVTRRGVMASHLEPPYQSDHINLPATERAAAECLQLPMHAGMSESDADHVIGALDRISKHA
jgi:perosamine synthetase